MHIPDGYLSPQTYVPLYGLFIAVLTTAIQKVKKTLTARMIPFLGMAAAFSFLIMMFNVPIPGGTTGHAVGAAIIALLFGPWVASISVSVALIIQAFVFGDGGLTAIGANCFNMAVFMPFMAYWIFKFIAGSSESSKRLTIAAFLSGYLSLCLAAILTGFEFGIQPVLAHSTDGVPLYAPYPLSIAVPVMALEHLLLFGIIEGVITALLFNYFRKNDFEFIEALKK